MPPVHPDNPNRKAACELCHSKKIRCIPSPDDRSKCTRCLKNNLHCVFPTISLRKGPPKGYTQALEYRVAQLEALLERLIPGIDLANYPDLGPKVDRKKFAAVFPPPEEKSKSDSSSSSPDDQVTLRNDAQSSFLQSPSTNKMFDSICGPSGNGVSTFGSPNLALLKSSQAIDSDPAGLDTEEMDSLQALTNQMSKIKMGDGSSAFPPHPLPYLGKSACGMEILGHLRDFHLKYSLNKDPDAFYNALQSICRPLFWRMPNWEKIPSEITKSRPTFPTIWPSPEVASLLIRNYFTHQNVYTPILHRPSFEKQFQEKLYLTDGDFESLCLAVFAIGSKWAPLYEHDAAIGNRMQYAKGWTYFSSWNDKKEQMTFHLFSMQAVTLFSVFRLGGSRHSWFGLVDQGMRSMIELGWHRRHIVSRKPRFEQELVIRTFYCMWAIEKYVCSLMARPSCIQDDEIDIPTPTEVDDAFWDDNFKQPEGIPSVVSFFVAKIQLTRLTGLSNRMVNRTNRTSPLKCKLSKNDPYSTEVARLDSLLNEWESSVLPSHLRWTVSESNPLWLSQSALLLSQFHATRIFAHRPFTPRVRKPDLLHHPSFLVCKHSATIGTEIVERLSRAMDIIPIEVVDYSFSFATIQLLHIWSAPTGDNEGAAKNVNRLMDVLGNASANWLSAGRMQDALRTVATFSSFTNYPMQQIVDLDPQPSSAEALFSSPIYLSTNSQQTPFDTTPLTSSILQESFPPMRFGDDFDMLHALFAPGSSNTILDDMLVDSHEFGNLSEQATGDAFGNEFQFPFFPNSNGDGFDIFNELNKIAGDGGDDQQDGPMRRL